MARKKYDFKSILELDSEMNQIQDFDILLERILLEARNVLHADAGSIYVRELANKEGHKEEVLAVKYAQNDTTAKLLPPGQKPVYSLFTVAINEKTISGYCGYSKSLVNVEDAYNLPPDVPFSFNTSFDKISGYKTTSSLAVPLITGEGKLLGVIQVFNAMDKSGKVVSFSKDDEFLITHFATNATRALQRAGMTRSMILRMIRMAELRDPKETGTHVNRVAGYAIEIYDRWAYNQGIPEPEREKYRDTFKIASMLHDVGKVAISDVILKKPAKFTPEEYQIMQRHTLYGAGLFDDFESSIENTARDIAFYHHENWDGTGYPGWVDPMTGEAIKTGPDGKPLGLKGEEIPLSGRIVAIADVYDALCSRRVYKEAWSEDEVLTEMRNLGGIKFDPELIEVFFEILPNIKHIQSRFPDKR
ncbi:MAG: HD domain-containing protein [Treponema sp.]|jgi:HD-GYP domain-containing protein (c-di-GMP phosphodiesterase class II)|nr:HD domain-containing protein [Treponema sp.]